MPRCGQLVVAFAALLVGSLLYAQAADVSPANSPANSSAKDDAQAASPAKPPAAKSASRPRAALAVTPEREAAVATFVDRNHPELLDLLLYLKSSQTDEYERAVREIFRTTERLAQIRERDPAQYDLEVTAWQAQSRVQLLAAKMQMDSNAELALELREALKLQGESRLALLKHERQKTAERLAKLDTDIARVESDRDAIIDRQLKLFSRSAAEKRPAKLNAKSSAKPTKKKP